MLRRVGEEAGGEKGVRLGYGGACLRKRTFTELPEG